MDYLLTQIGESLIKKIIRFQFCKRIQKYFHSHRHTVLGTIQINKLLLAVRSKNKLEIMLLSYFSIIRDVQAVEQFCLFFIYDRFVIIILFR